MRYLILLLITACTATGPSYTSETKGNVIIYRTSAMAGALSPYHIQIGDKHCALQNGGFFPVTLKKKDILVAGWAKGSVSDTIEVNPGDFVRVEHSVGAAMLSGGGTGFGALGGAITAQNQGSGDFRFSKMPASMAKSELSSLNQDCINAAQ